MPSKVIYDFTDILPMYDKLCYSIRLSDDNTGEKWSFDGLTFRIGLGFLNTAIDGVKKYCCKSRSSYLYKNPSE